MITTTSTSRTCHSTQWRYLFISLFVFEKKKSSMNNEILYSFRQWRNVHMFHSSLSTYSNNRQLTNAIIACRHYCAHVRCYFPSTFYSLCNLTFSLLLFAFDCFLHIFFSAQYFIHQLFIFMSTCFGGRCVWQRVKTEVTPPPLRLPQQTQHSVYLSSCFAAHLSHLYMYIYECMNIYIYVYIYGFAYLQCAQSHLHICDLADM